MSDFGLDLFSTSGIYNCTDHNWGIKLEDIVLNINNVLFTAFNTDENLNSKIGKRIDINPHHFFFFVSFGKHILFLIKIQESRKCDDFSIV